jgi:adenine-specific DNA methylase
MAPSQNLQSGEVTMDERQNDTPRLIEHAFPLKQASLDSVHEKNVRHGHISTLHIWPARRPLAACRAALIATLLPDPGTPEKRKELCEKIGGRVVKKVEKKKMPNGETVERDKEITEGGILHWGRETENKEDLEWFRQEIRKAYGGRAPKVLDPFAGGGAIPLEAMRLGCDVTAVDINPVAWFILKCTLEYPQKLAGKTYPLPAFILRNDDFMSAFYKAHPHLVGRTKQTKTQKEHFAQDLFLRDKQDSGRAPKADLGWHVRAWGRWVLDHARRELAQYYPTYADFEPLDLKTSKPYEPQPMRSVPLNENGTPEIEKLNSDFSKEYLSDRRNPRWVLKPTVAYLWARTLKCKNCRATVPLLKTRWLCKKKGGNRERVLLTIDPSSDGKGVTYSIQKNVPQRGGNAAQKREYDKKLGQGTMSKAGAKCPCCPAIMTMEDIKTEARRGNWRQTLVAVTLDGPRSKEFRLPTDIELKVVEQIESVIETCFQTVPFGLPLEDTPAGGGRRASRAFSMRDYGQTKWQHLFTSRQLLALGTFCKRIRQVKSEVLFDEYDEAWRHALYSYLCCGFDRLVDFANVNVQWKIDVPTINHALVRFAIQITWDFAEGNVIGKKAGGFLTCLDRIATGLDTLMKFPADVSPPNVAIASAQRQLPAVDLVVTDPPYYDAIPYSDLMDWFYVWLRRVSYDLTPDFQEAMKNALGPKWDKEKADGELIDDESRHNGDLELSKRTYEEGMTKVFRSVFQSLTDDGRLVVVFANKNPDAWETLVTSVIRSGFIVTGSWPIQTEQPSRMRGLSSAALASSVWLVCKKRVITARAGWDNQVLDEMRQKIGQQLRAFWDAGIRGPDFVWAATGPALEAYSKHPIVKKANDPGQLMNVDEFLGHVRRMVVDFVVGRVLAGENEDGADLALAERLDEPTAYYLLHRNDFQMEDAPVGACILYAISCGLSDGELANSWDLISFTKGKTDDEGDDEQADVDAEADVDIEEDSGSKVKLKTWAQRKSRSLGYEAPGGKPVPLIDRVHCLMHLWKGGELSKVDEYLDSNGLRRQELFKRLLQSLIELSPHASEERSLLESISNHIQAKGAVWDDKQKKLFATEVTENTES